MKQSIQLRLGQHLTMTPQLQQAIRLLQLSTVELQLEIQQILESNLMLENGDSEAQEESSQKESSEDATSDSGNADQEQNSATAADNPADAASETMPDELALDSSWEDTYDTGATPHTSAVGGEGDNRDVFETLNTDEESLQDHLNWQMELTPFSDSDRAIAAALIDSINDDGYLGTSTEEIHQGLTEELEDVELDEVEAVLHRIQRFDPVGVGSRDLKECLHIQLQQFDPDTPYIDQAQLAVDEYLDLLGNRDYNQLMRRLKVQESDLQQIITLIQSLNPRPGSQIASTKAQYIVPDVYVSKRNGKWRVELNPESAPKVRINSQYAGMVRRADNSDDNQYLRNHLQEARWFLKSLQSRNETLLKVATCIVDRQQDSLEFGEEHMKPLVLRDVAETVEMHESTISRVTTQKYMHTPKGIFEFKHFFSSHVGTADGGECSAVAIRAMIKKLVALETPVKPLSDSKIANLLSDQGINVARRTIAKYREAMAIPPSNERKRLA